MYVTFSIGLTLVCALHRTNFTKFESIVYCIPCNLYVYIFRWSPQMAHSIVFIHFHSSAHHNRFNCWKKCSLFAAFNLCDFYCSQSPYNDSTLSPCLTALLASLLLLWFFFLSTFTCWCVLNVHCNLVSFFIADTAFVVCSTCCTTHSTTQHIVQKMAQTQLQNYNAFALDWGVKH